MFPSKWLEDHPNIPQWFPLPMESSSPENIDRQNKAIEGWNGTYDRLSFISSSTMVITGTEDLVVPPENALILAGKISGSWLVRFAGAGHGLMYQYPDKLGKIVENFLEM